MKKFRRASSAGLMAAAMLASSTAAFVAPVMNASAGQCLGETTFAKKGLPWHTCVTPPAEQKFKIGGGVYEITIVENGGEDVGGESVWDCQFRHRGLKIQRGHNYEVKWSVNSSADGTMNAHIANLAGEDPVWHNQKPGGQGWDKTVIKKGDNTFSSEFTAASNLEVAEWAFHYGGAGGEWNKVDCMPNGAVLKFSNMSLVCKTCGTNYTEGSCNWDPDNTLGEVTAKNNVRVNQVGYFPNRQKLATWVIASVDPTTGTAVTASKASTRFDILNSSGVSVYNGMTDASKPFATKSDFDSGDCAHLIDFSDFTTPGTYTIKVGTDESHPFTISADLYKNGTKDLLRDAVNYYYHNRSGVPTVEAYITSYNENPKYKQSKASLTAAAGHVKDTAYVQPKWVLAYDASGSDVDKKYTIDGTGGWYDAGDHGKYVVNGGISVWTLQNMYELAKKNGKEAVLNNSIVIPESGAKLLQEAKVELDWFFKMIVSSSDPAWGSSYAGLVYHKLHDHKWTGLAVKPDSYAEEWGTIRIVKPPTLAATLNLAACAAQASRLWKAEGDTTYAATCLTNAKLTYEKAKSLYSTWVPYDPAKHNPSAQSSYNPYPTNDKSLYAPLDQAIGGGPYGDNELRDDFYWAACELYATTGDETYLADLKKYGADYGTAVPGGKDMTFTIMDNLQGGENKGSFSSFNWGCTASLGSLSLYVTDVLTGADKTKLENSIVEVSDKYIAFQKTNPHGIPYEGSEFTDPINLGYEADGKTLISVKGYEWGSNSFVINNAIVNAYAYLVSGDTKHLDGCTESVDYIFGRNANGFSYVSGYGTYTLENPHHRLWSYELDNSFPKCPNGVLSGGPGAGMQDPYVGGLNYQRGKVPSQKCYVDSIEAWSVNEVTVNWNAPLAWIAGFLDVYGNDAGGSITPTQPTQPTTGGTQEGTKLGDVNVDGSVTIEDVVKLRLYLLNATKYPVSAAGLANAQVKSGTTTISAAHPTIIQDYIVGQIITLPN